MIRTGWTDEAGAFTGVFLTDEATESPFLKILKAGVERLVFGPDAAVGDGTYRIDGVTVPNADHAAVADAASDSAKLGGVAAASYSQASHNHNGTYCRWRGSFDTPPESPQNGDIYYDTILTVALIYDAGSENWIQI